MIAADQPVVGWTVSCDARLFAAEYSGMPVDCRCWVLREERDDEQIAMDDIVKCVEFLTLYILQATGTISDG